MIRAHTRHDRLRHATAAAGPARFWQVADYFRQSAPSWVPANAGFELRRVLMLRKKRWTVCFRIHVVPRGDGTRKGGVRLGFKSSVTLWPPRLSKAEENTLKQDGWYAKVHRVLLRVGYHGAWRRSPWGTFGDFWKQHLAGVAGVQRERGRLERLRLGS